MDDAILKGARVLLLEHDSLINLSTTEIIEEMGCTVSSFMRLNEGITAAKEELPDVAVLDVNIGGQLSYELADLLHEQKVPIVFLTGYDSPAVEGRWRDRPVCRKPCDSRELRALLIKALATRQDVQG